MKDVPRHWRSTYQRSGLRLVEVCEGCGVQIVPPRDLCPECNGSIDGRGVFMTSKSGFKPAKSRGNWGEVSEAWQDLQWGDISWERYFEIVSPSLLMR